MKFFRSIIVCAIVLGIGSLLFVWFGVYDIAATSPHWSITSSFIDIFRDRSIAVRADDLQVPILEDAKFSQEAFSHYHGMCRFCHGAPGYSPEEFADGLYPSPPTMTSGYVQKEHSKSEIYWIAKHGIKMTGMPAFGHTHSEDQLWALVALTEDMPSMTAEQYREFIKESHEGNHRHMHSVHDEEREIGNHKEKEGHESQGNHNH
ncbi:MAG: cytochrome c [Proteobacteria bacterium]|nr:cytochrome c [Pseudomonadota bacterium]MBU4470586.1 cytochrome c [Pseudomonadota bacterium]MCG2751421.1 cytochrome c [Desulfobacteraceae bacterium]